MSFSLVYLEFSSPFASKANPKQSIKYEQIP